jgi:hypothetical protein
MGKYGPRTLVEDTGHMERVRENFEENQSRDENH